MRKQTKQELLWRTMKMLKIFSLQDLAIYASLPERVLTVPYVNNYINKLRDAGYIAFYSKGRYGSKYWKLLFNTGSEAPRIRKDGIYDPNIQQKTNKKVLALWNHKQYYC